MTLVLGLRCREGVVLASDSQRTEGNLRQSIPKLFVSSPVPIIWGTAGSIAIQQELYGVLQELSIPDGMPRRETRDAVVTSLMEAVRRATANMSEPSEAASRVEGVFAWYSRADGRDYLLRALSTGYAELAPSHTAVGSGTVEGVSETV